MRLTTDGIRQRFLEFFAGKEHTIVPSASLIPGDDPTVLFTSAGMNQFKDCFLGKRKDLKRAASCQKCLRTGDLDNVGKTPSHHTFFEMLGNFSFGDYFKREAIEWAWEFLTGTLKLAEKDLWASVYREDEESFGIWKSRIGLPEKKIIRLGDEENFWPANARRDGPNGPCGPCSEIYFDRGEQAGCRRPDCRPGCDCPRFVEVWNLVFTQFERREGGILEPLPQRNIDTGMGMERIAAVMQGAATNFEIDVFRPIVDSVRQMAKNGKADEKRNVINAIADHARAVVFLVDDGILPSNEGRGYVERMLIRRAAGMGRDLGLDKPFLYRLVPTVAAAMKKPYPELIDRRENISQIIRSEEERFQDTLAQGTDLLKAEIEAVLGRKEKIVSGGFAFQLYDTYGFPLSLTEEMAGKRGLGVDREGFERELKAQRQRSREGSRMGNGGIFARTFENEIRALELTTEFAGYDRLQIRTETAALFKDSKRTDSLGEGENGSIVCRATPFYGEFGGQVGDVGSMEKPGGDGKPEAKAEVTDARRIAGVIVHSVTVKKGVFRAGDAVELNVDEKRRGEIARHHTATHLLQAALRQVLGKHVEQSGSEVRPDGFRFDFSHYTSITPRERERVEELVNGYVMKNDPVATKEMGLKEAKESGALALFTEKYGEKVRVVAIGDYSRELCGGTHVRATGEIGFFRITGESSVAAGTRRIEALAGEAACRAAREDREKIEKVGEILKSPRARLDAAVKEITVELKQAQREISALKRKLLEKDLAKTAGAAVCVGEIRVISRLVAGEADMDALRSLAEKLKGELGEKNAVVVLGSIQEGKANLVAAVTEDLSRERLNAVEIIRELARRIDGGGGGRRDFAQAGGKSPDKLGSALAEVAGIIKEKLQK